MFESYIIVEDVGIEPDYRGEWPKLGVARVYCEFPFISPNLGKVEISRIPICEIGKEDHALVVMSARCSVQYFDDSSMQTVPPSSGTMGWIDVLPFYIGGDEPKQLCCNDISKVVFETHREFDVLPEIIFYPFVDNRDN